MSKVADPLRKWATMFMERVVNCGNGCACLDAESCMSIANEMMADAADIDSDHERRMEQAKRDALRDMARDMHWAVTMFEACESRRCTREALEDEGTKNDQGRSDAHC